MLQRDPPSQNDEALCLQGRTYSLYETKHHGRPFWTLLIGVSSDGNSSLVGSKGLKP